MIKILDGRILNDAYWLFSGALSNVEYRIFLKDTSADVHYTLFNESGLNRSFADTKAFPETVDAASASQPPRRSADRHRGMQSPQRRFFASKMIDLKSR